MKTAKAWVLTVGLAVLGYNSAQAAVIGMSANVGSGPASIGFQEFIPSTDPRAVNGLDTLRYFTQSFAPAGDWTFDITVTRMASDTGASSVNLSTFIFNNTGEDWTGFDFALVSTAGDGLGFLSSPAPTNEGAIFTAGPSFSSPPAASEDSLSWGGGTLVPALDTLFQMAVTIPESLFQTPAGTPDVEVAQFSLNASPNTVLPEPSTLAAFGVGVLGLLGYGLRRRRKAA